MKRKFHEIEQSTDEWLELRTGFITSSNFSTIMANYGKAFGNPAVQYAQRVAIESKTKRCIETYSNQWMDRGVELEDDARQMYSDLNFADVLPGGFMQYGHFGSSSDGLTDDGMIEIKCPKYSTHFNTIVKGGYDESYQWQIRGQMWIYNRPWCDFVSYCPDFPLDKQLYVYRVERDKELEEKLVGRLNEFVTVVNSYIKHLE
jgi:putative phage-type endonuclease